MDFIQNTNHFYINIKSLLCLNAISAIVLILQYWIQFPENSEEKRDK